jgi:hypothetical protein
MTARTPRSSRVSAEQTSAWKLPDGEPSPSAKSTPTPTPSSPSDGPASRTWGTLSNSLGTDGAWGAGSRDENGLTLDSGPAVFHARTSASPASGPGSPASEASSPSPSSTLWSDTDLPPSSSRTYRDSSPRIAVGTWPPSSVAWQNSGMAWRTGFSTLATSECPSAADESSSLVCAARPTTLTDILQPTAPPRFSLSARAAQGILRRASRRGRELPTALAEALRSLSDATQEVRPGMDGTPLTPSVRRLTPVECERLMGWPDGWTVATAWRTRSGRATGTMDTAAHEETEPTTSSPVKPAKDGGP